MDKFKQKLIASKNHVKTHRAKYAAAGTATAFLLLNARNNRILTEFLEEKGIDPNEYWTPEDENA